MAAFHGFVAICELADRARREIVVDYEAASGQLIAYGGHLDYTEDGIGEVSKAIVDAALGLTEEGQR